MPSHLELVAPSRAYAPAFFALVDEFLGAGERQYTNPAEAHAAQDVAAYLRQTEEQAQGIGLPEGYVPGSTYWLVRDQKTIVGTSALRHYLTPALEDVGGHIAYRVRPSERRKGYGERLLALTLEQARARGLTRVLITCDTDNVGSARVAEKNGGVLTSQGLSPLAGVEVSRYWIAL